MIEKRSLENKTDIYKDLCVIDAAQNKFLEVRVKSPLFAASFVTPNLLLVGGGGGDKRSGIPSILILLDMKIDSQIPSAEIKAIFDLKDELPLNITFSPQKQKIFILKENTICFSSLQNLKKSLQPKKPFEISQFNVPVENETPLKLFSFESHQNRLSTCITSNVVNIYDCPEQRETLHLQGCLVTRTGISSVNWQPNGNMIAIAFKTNGFSLYSAEIPHNEIARIDLEGEVPSLVFTDSSTLLVCVNTKHKSFIKLCKISDIVLGHFKRGPTRDFRDRISKISFAGNLTAITTYKKEVYLIDLPSLNTVKKIRTAHDLPITAISLSPEKSLLTTVGADGKIILYNCDRIRAENDRKRIIWRIFVIVLPIIFVVLFGRRYKF